LNTQEIFIRLEEEDFIFPQELKNLMERNLKASEVQYIAHKHKGEVFLLEHKIKIN